MIDPLAQWWVHQVTVRRYLRSDGYGVPVLDIVQTLAGFVSDGTKLVAGPEGQQVASSAQVAFPASTAYIAVNSEITLPAQFGGRTSIVIAAARADGGGQPTPDHLQVALQ